MSNFAKDLEFWMTNLPQRLRLVPIIHLAIPGSHDSTTFAICQKSTISPDARNPIPYLTCLEPILKPVMIRWSRTQSIDILQQLESGIRYFDFRIATKMYTHKFYFVHNLYSESVNSVLEQINEFLDHHSKEIVIIDCQHFFNFSLNDHQRLISLLYLTFGPKLLPFTPLLNQVSLEFMTSNGHQIVLIYRHEAAIVEEVLWPSCSFVTLWPNTVLISKLMPILDESLERRNLNAGFVSQCVLTPTVWYVCKNIFGSLKSKLVLPLEKIKYEWLHKQTPGKGGLNIVISDYIENNDYQFSKEVVNLNMKLYDLLEETPEVSDEDSF